jgi:hypothetical protein
MKANLTDTIKDLGERQRIDQAKFSTFEFEMFSLKKSNRKIEQIEN